MKKIDDWIENREKLEKSFQFYLKKNLLRKIEVSEELIKEHIRKAYYNLEFASDVEEKGYYDWQVIIYYYAMYHSALALLMKQGYVSKGHLATICVLVKYYFQKGLDKNDINNLAMLSKENLDEFADIKDKRETASYSTSVEFEKKTAELIKSIAINFVLKVKNILKENV